MYLSKLSKTNAFYLENVSQGLFNNRTRRMEMIWDDEDVDGYDDNNGDGGNEDVNGYIMMMMMLVMMLVVMETLIVMVTVVMKISN